jgi:hypothetical protein
MFGDDLAVEGVLRANGIDGIRWSSTLATQPAPIKLISIVNFPFFQPRFHPKRFFSLQIIFSKASFPTTALHQSVNDSKSKL